MIQKCLELTTKLLKFNSLTIQVAVLTPKYFNFLVLFHANFYYYFRSIDVLLFCKNLIQYLILSLIRCSQQFKFFASHSRSIR